MKTADWVDPFHRRLLPWNQPAFLLDFQKTQEQYTFRAEMRSVGEENEEGAARLSFTARIERARFAMLPPSSLVLSSGMGAD